MKKNILIISVVIVLLILAGVGIFFRKNSTLKATLPQKGGVLKVQKAGSANLDIVYAPVKEISVNLKGPGNALSDVRFFKAGGGSTLEVTEEWENITGAITVPEDTLIELDMPEEEGERDRLVRLGGGSGSYPSIHLDDGDVTLGGQGGTGGSGGQGGGNGGGGGAGDGNQHGDQDGDSGGDTPPSSPPPNEPNPVPPPPPGDDEEEGAEEPQTTEYAPDEPEDPHVRCSIKLKQEDRNECCQTNFADEPHPACAHNGYWLFNYHTRLCYYHCFHPCHKEPTEARRNQCCANQRHYDTTPPCIGNWEYNDATTGCSYECMTEDELEEFFGDPDVDYVDFVSEACSQHSNPDQCCDYNLRNELSIGPRPGFPDCIGLWDFTDGNKCQFRCASHGEMLEIMERLKERAQ